MRKMEKCKNKPIKSKQHDENKKINFDQNHYEKIVKEWNNKKKCGQNNKYLIDEEHAYLNDIWDINLHPNKFKCQNR